MTHSKLAPFPPLSKTPLVSCVIILFNNEDFLAAAIESVLAQTYPHWELLLVDDGSVDGSSQIAQKYAQNNAQQVQYLEHPRHQNKGKNASRNLGIQQAKGALIALLDGDDEWLPQKLSEQVAAYQQHPTAGMLYGRTLVWHSWTGQAKDEKRDHFAPLGVPPNTLVSPPALAINLLQGGYQTPTTCNAIVRREVFDQIGSFDEDYREVFEDTAFFIQLALNFPVFVADNYWANYRKHDASSCAHFAALEKRHTTHAYNSRLRHLAWIEAYLVAQSYQNPDVWAVVKNRQKKFKARQQLSRVRVLGLWRQVLSLVTSLGIKTLPDSWRERLWQSVGRHWYV